MFTLETRGGNHWEFRGENKDKPFPTEFEGSKIPFNSVCWNTSNGNLETLRDTGEWKPLGTD